MLRPRDLVCAPGTRMRDCTRGKLLRETRHAGCVVCGSRRVFEDSARVSSPTLELREDTVMRTSPHLTGLLPMPPSRALQTIPFRRQACICSCLVDASPSPNLIFRRPP